MWTPMGLLRAQDDFAAASPQVDLRMKNRKKKKKGFVNSLPVLGVSFSDLICQD